MLRGILQCRKVLRPVSFNVRDAYFPKTCINTNGNFTRLLSVTTPNLDKSVIQITFLRASGEKITTKANVGDTLLDVVVNNNIDLDGFGAYYEKLPDKPGDEELDMLDLAYDLTDTSRLGCQITLTKDMDGLVVQVPTTVNDARSA